MFHLDYFSCLLTVFSTILVGRKLWIGLAVGALNSLLICIIGFKTSQFGFIPANVFCIAVYAISIRSWRRATGQQEQAGMDRDAHPAPAQEAASDASNSTAAMIEEENTWQNPHRRLSRA